MRSRVTFFQLNPQMFAEVVDLYKESTLPAGRQANGNQGMLLLTNHATGKGIAVSLWETAEDLAASEGESGYYHGELAKYLPHYTVPPGREEFDVILSE